MSSGRPLLNTNIDELEDLFLHAHDKDELLVLYNELKCRSKLRAYQLLEKVVESLKLFGVEKELPQKPMKKMNTIPVKLGCFPEQIGDDSKSIASELAVAFGIAGIKFDTKSMVEALSVDKDFAEKCTKHSDETFVKCSLQAGEKVRERFGNNISCITLTRQEKAQYTDVASKDMELSLGGIGKTNVSVKYASDVVWNGAAERFLVDVPNGQKPKMSYTLDWFECVAPIEYQRLFQAMGGCDFFGVHTPTLLKRQISRDRKKQFAQQCADLLANDENIRSEYKSFCNMVSSATAGIFNFHLRNAGNDTYLLNTIAWEFFRIDNTRHIICGMGNEKLPLAILVYNRSEWAQRWETVSIKARPNLSKNQPEIAVTFDFWDVETQKSLSFDMNVEIRWSHGKFVSKPECKIKKAFRYGALPWCEVL